MFCCFDCIRNIQTNFKNSKQNTIVGSVINGLELGKEANMEGKKNREKTTTVDFVISSITADYDIINCLIFEKNY